jgi:hypothetical protein
MPDQALERTRRNLHGMVLALLVFTSCGYEEEISRDQLLNAPEVILIEGQQLVLNTSVLLAYNSQEGIFGPCSIGVDSIRFSSPLTMDCVWLVRGEDVWKGNLIDKGAWADSTNVALLMTFRDGPRWELFDTVDVIVRVWHAGEARLLRASKKQVGQMEPVFD